MKRSDAKELIAVMWLIAAQLSHGWLAAICSVTFAITIALACLHAYDERREDA